MLNYDFLHGFRINYDLLLLKPIQPIGKLITFAPVNRPNEALTN